MMPTLINPIKLASWSIRSRLTVWYASCVLLILVVVSVLSLYVFRTTLIADTDRSLTIRAAAIVAKVTGGDQIRYQRKYDRLPLSREAMTQNARLAFDEQEFDSSGDPIYIDLVDAGRGNIVVSSANIMRHGFVERMLGRVPSNTKVGVHAFFVGSDKENELRVLLVSIPQSPYTLMLATPWSRNEDALTPQTGTIAWIVLIFVVMSGLGGWLLVGRTLHPINEIVAEARKFRGDHLEPAFVAARTYGKDEIGNLVEALNEMMARVHRSVSMQRQFTADASHDLRTPLTILRGEVEFALARDRSPEQYRAALKNCLDATDRLIRIVTDLNELAMADTQDSPPSQFHGSVVNVVDLCRIVVGIRQSEAGSRNIALSLRDNCSPRAALISANPLGLERAVGNLIDNAIRYNRAGGSVEVVVGSEQDGRITIDVVDTGIGISESDQPYIFDRFYRGDKARRSSEQDGHSSGSGLGLAIAQYVVASCGGELKVSSQIDRGSRFTIRLPAFQDDSGE